MFSRKRIPSTEYFDDFIVKKLKLAECPTLILSKPPYNPPKPLTKQPKNDIPPNIEELLNLQLYLYKEQRKAFGK